MNDTTIPDPSEHALPHELLTQFLVYGRRAQFPKNATVVLEGEAADSLFVVIEGRLVTYVDDQTGKLVELSRLGPGQYFGELMLANTFRTASVKTLTATTLCIIQRADFERLISARPDLAFHVIQTLIARVTSLTKNVRGLALMDVYGRVALLLLDSAQDSEGTQVVRGMSQQTIADRVGASRSMINRIMQDLEAGGYISSMRGSIELKRILPKRW